MFYFLLDVYSQIKQISFVFKTMYILCYNKYISHWFFFINSNCTHTVIYSIMRTTEILEFEIDFRPLGRIRRGRLRGTYLTWWYGGYQN